MSGNPFPPEYVVVNEQPGLTDVLVDLRYGSTNNFSGADQYGPLKKCYLHRVAAEKLLWANDLLAASGGGRRFLVLDALRPRSVQRKLWPFVKGTPQEKYLADPEQGSIHNYGLAIDLTLASADGTEVDMGTAFDAFEELAEPRHEERFRAEGRLTDAHLEARWLLRGVMSDAGFLTVPHEWWHFEALPRNIVRADYAIIE